MGRSEEKRLLHGLVEVHNMESYRILLDDVIKGLREKKDFSGRWCEHYTDDCDKLLKEYADGKSIDCGHKCEYCDKFRWVIDRAMNYSEKLDIPIDEIIQSWEEGRRYWYMNYYQECNQPRIESDNVFVFENLEEMREKCGKEFICPICKGISTNPYECNSGKIVGIGKKGKACDWKSYGLFQHDLAFIYVKSERKGEKMFMPKSLIEKE